MASSLAEEVFIEEYWDVWKDDLPSHAVMLAEWIDSKVGAPVESPELWTLDPVHYAMICFREDLPLPQGLRLWLSDSFARIKEGEAPRKALGLGRPKGRPTEDTRLRDGLLAALVTDRIHSGETYEKSVAHVAQEEAASSSTVKRAYSRYSIPWSLLRQGRLREYLLERRRKKK